LQIVRYQTAPRPESSQPEIAMIVCSAMGGMALTDEERAALEQLAAFGPDRGLDPPLRGRLALYKLIDETPQGWTITALGREALVSAPPRQPKESRIRPDEAAPHAEGERHYGRKSRDTSWLD
jgi:hypothetical protein